MFRIGLKFPCNGLNRVKKHGYSRLYLTARYYDTRARAKCEPDGRLLNGRDVKLISRYSGYKYSTDSQRSGKGKGGRSLLTLSAVGAVGAIGFLAYVRTNPELRATLEGWIPGTDKTIQIIFQEESSYFDFILTFLGSLKNSLLGSSETSAKDTSAPKPAFVPLFEREKPPTNEPRIEIRVAKPDDEKPQTVLEDPVPMAAPREVPEELKPTNLVELETFCGDAAAKAIAAYQKAVCAIQDYNKDVMKVMESEISGNVVWQKLREATKKRKESLNEAEKHANEALDSLKKLNNLIDDPQFDAPSHVKTVARRNVKKIVDDVDDAKKKYQDELENTKHVERYWKQVKAARESFIDELEILFPNVNIQEKKLSVDEDAFDLFVLYTYNKINNLQKNLEKLSTVAKSKLTSALKADGTTDDRVDALVCLRIDEVKQSLEDEFNKKLLEKEKKFDEEMRRQLKLQAQVHTDQLQEALKLKDQEAERLMNRVLSEQSEADSVKYKTQLAAIVGRLQALQTALKARIEEERRSSNAQVFWSACLALARAVKSAPPGTSAEKAIRPLEPEIKAVSKAAPKGDPLITAVMQGIPEEAAKRGVYPEDALRARFLKVESLARRLAMVPEEGASLPMYLLSYLQSLLIINPSNPIPKGELEDKPIDIESLNTYEILHRARYWMDRGDFKMTLRYMNLLKGAPKSIARDWMKEARILLETQQVIDTLLAYAGTTGLAYVDSVKQAQ